jgi:hypothetical protein
MSMRTVQWPRAIGGALAAEAGQIVATVLWVAFYSYVINPGQPVAAYQAHAQAAGPWVSITAGFVIFYAASRWIARSTSTALALFGVFVIVDELLLIVGGAERSLVYMAFAGTSYVTKLAACYLGGRDGASATRVAPA